MTTDLVAQSMKWPQYRLRFLLEKTRSREEIKRLEQVEEVSFIPMEGVGENGEIDASQIKSKEEVSNGYTLFFEGDVLVAKITPCFENGKGAVARGLIGGVGFGTTELYVLNPSGKLDEQFLYYLTISEPFRKLGEASMKGAAGQKRVPDEFIQDYRFRLPPLKTQRRIADYLDRETARIDALVAEKEKMLALLEEKRTALISRAVTRGLDPDAPLKSSGLDWLGDIPAHWETTHFKFVCELGPEVDVSDISADDVVTFLPMDRIKNGYFIENTETFSKYNTSYNLFAEGDIVLAKVTPCFENGNIAIAENLVNKVGFGSSEIFVIRPIKADQKFIFYYLQSDYFKQQGEASMTGAGGLKRVSPDFVRGHIIALPPKSEQRAVAEYLDKSNMQIKSVQTEIVKSINLLKERRAALITAAVTGRIDMEAMTA